jgi:zinc transporter
MIQNDKEKKYMDVSNGLTYGHLLDKHLQDIKMTWEDVDDWNPDQGILWIHLDANNDAAVDWLEQKSGLNPVVQESFLEQGTRPRYLTFKEGTLIILRSVNCNPGEDPDDMVAIKMLISDRRIITMGRNRIMAVADIHGTFLKRKGPDNVGKFVVMIMDRISDRIAEITTDIEDRVADIEEKIIDSEAEALRPQLAELRRQSISLRRYIAPQRDMLARLQHEEISWLTESDRIVLREIAEQTARFVDDIDATRELALIAQEELDSRLSEQMNKAMYLMSIVAAIFLPLSLITGLWGINVGGIPGGGNPRGFWIITSFLIILAVFLVLWFKKIKWL